MEWYEQMNEAHAALRHIMQYSKPLVTLTALSAPTHK